VPLRTYQQEATDFGLSARRWILADAPGAGKTATALAWMEAVRERRTLIVAPLQVLHHWAAQAATFAPNTHVVVGTGTAAQRAAARRAVEFPSRGETTALVINYEAMRIDIDRLVTMGFGTVIFDEAHRLKNRATVQRKCAAKLARRAANLCLATATPVLNSADELWSPLALIDHGKYPSYWRWAEARFVIETPTYGYSLKPVLKIGPLLPGAAETIKGELAGKIIQRTLSDVLPAMTDPIQTVLSVDLSPAERKAYDQLMKHKWVELDGEVTSTTNVVARQTRARQITSDWGTIQATLDVGSKSRAAIELYEDLAPERVVILTAFRATAQRIAAATGGALYMGGMSAAERHEAIEAFRSGRSRAFVGTLQAVGEGLDGLQVARHMILVDRSWVPATNDQAIGRLQRSGQTGIVQVTHLVARNTIDETVAQALVDKRDVIGALGLAVS